jgi:ElaB/YqjD/DUF883 family membrane-anchored ribosome-binding protein
MGSVGGTVGQTGSGLGSNIENKLDALKDKASRLVEEGSEKVDHLKHRVVDVKDQAMARGGQFMDQATSFIQANPLKSVAIAFGVGYIGMRIFRR